jgi:beta-alanine--pyruvate transaminase
LERPGLRGARLTQELFDAGLIIKMTGDALLVSPPFICEDAHLDELFTKIRDVLKTH